MLSALAPLRRHRVVRASAAAIFCYGFAGAATNPYQSVLAIRDLGFSNSGYATIALAAAVANVVSAIAIGMVSDRFHSYRAPLIFVALLGVLSYGAIWLAPHPIIFAAVTIGPMAVFHATNSLLFGNVRAHSARYSTTEADDINALMRMTISLAWVLVPGGVALILRDGSRLIDAWLIAACLAGACLAVILFWLEPDRRPVPEALPAGGTGTSPVAPTTGRPDRPAQVRGAKGAAMVELARLLNMPVMVRILGVALVSQALTVNGMALPLITTGRVGGTLADVGVVVGMVAGIEVVFMIVWIRLARRIPMMAALAAGMALYAAYLLWLAVAGAPWEVYAASVIGGVGAAGIIALPIGFLLDLIRDRPGLSASLIAVNMFLGSAIGAGIFAVGSALGGYGMATALSAGVGMGGTGLLAWLERRRE
ncbi:MFS transporter [Falsirhodobacter halotolerans]|uniref:MFS transporter n=1 Tax=Falsirhodobacter halotolerans TaxID=1146892 RepID=UPI001FD20129|nr:MFS transporter [Falsirhodobacter halotolerans]MCJ8141272.1 MFS transporter [Falsirhodobacter halotolerans]